MENGAHIVFKKNPHIAQIVGECSVSCGAHLAQSDTPLPTQSILAEVPVLSGKLSETHRTTPSGEFCGHLPG